MRLFLFLILVTLGISLKAQPCTVFVDNVADCGLNCSGSSTAYATGQAPFTYSWQPTGQTTQQITSLCAGSYTVTVTDSLGCVVVDSVTINGSPVLNVWISSLTNPTCVGCSNGSATGSVNGGTPPYFPFWIPPIGQGMYTVNGLPQGTYTFCVTDTNGCTSCVDTVVQDPLGIHDAVQYEQGGTLDLYDLNGRLIWNGSSTNWYGFLCSNELTGCFILVRRNEFGETFHREKIVLIQN